MEVWVELVERVGFMVVIGMVAGAGAAAEVDDSIFIVNLETIILHIVYNIYHSYFFLVHT